MPEYLAPAVYVEETSFRAKSIEGVSTSTTGFVGPTRKGPTTGAPELITSFGDFERIYGGYSELEFAGGNAVNYIANAVKNYFDNGGARLYVARVETGGVAATSEELGGGGSADDNIQFIARTTGSVGNGSVSVQLVNVEVTVQAMRRAVNGTILVDGATLYRRNGTSWVQDDGTVFVYNETTELWADSGDTALPAQTSSAALFATFNVLAIDADGNESFYENMGMQTGHPRYVGDLLSATPGRRIEQLENTFAIVIGANVNGFRLHEILLTVTLPVDLTGGSDGSEPTAANYTVPLESLARIEGISILASPGYASFIEANRNAIQDALITHAETRRAYRIAVLETPQAHTVTTALEIKSRIDSSYAALYYPWVFSANPLAEAGNESISREVLLPPSGFICGIYARNDNTKGVSKSPGNETVRGALRFETDVSFAEQEVLNPRGVNCLRFFPGRGNRLWGARTTSSDPEWKYVGPRRYFLYLEHSIDRSTQWAVFENNGPLLWENVRETVSSFLYNEWVSGALLGANPDEAYFVRCDRTTMTQNDLDNGRLICLIGVAALKPAEFVVFRIGQKTAGEARS
ncbi:Phage tail sheath protein FI [hydrothermal vent metagenome]|uniref:Phage tail sheath protein FI n=1 Tax=hydrothermal vent metagenome TaxID=652676 RepID=A0A3B0Y4D9_9ZZZZ